MNSVLLRTGGLLLLSNIFMTFAWYAHLRNLGNRPWYVAALVSWGLTAPLDPWTPSPTFPESP
jgi:uncharacterized protein (DUF486 family)